MGKPLFKASDGDQIDILREREDVTRRELQQGPETQVVYVTKVRPEAFPSGCLGRIEVKKKVRLIGVRMGNLVKKDQAKVEARAENEGKVSHHKEFC